MSNRARKPIYGSAAFYGCRDQEKAERSCDTRLAVALADLLTLIEATTTVIGNFFPALVATAPCIANMGYSMSLSPVIIVWLKWRDVYPDEKIDIESPDSLDLLKDLYLEMGLPWELDPFLKPKSAPESDSDDEVGKK